MALFKSEVLPKNGLCGKMALLPGWGNVANAVTHFGTRSGQLFYKPACFASMTH